MIQRILSIIIVSLFIGQSTLANPLCETTLSPKQARFVSQLESRLQTAVQISQIPILPQHALLWPLVEAFATLKGMDRATPATLGYLASVMTLNPIGAMLFGTKAWLDYGTANIEARAEAVRAVSRDAGMQALLLIAFEAGQLFRGKVPQDVQKLFAKYFEMMTDDIPRWKSDLAYDYLAVQRRWQADGFERAQWDVNAFQRQLENPIRYIIDEIQHTRYTFDEASRHLAQHRLSGLRALLDGRPLDAINLQMIGDRDIMDAIQDDYH